MHIYETTAFGTPLRATELKVDDPGRFGQLLRERVDASIVVQRHVPLAGKRGVRIVGRRNPADTDAAVAWNFVLDKGLEPDQPGVSSTPPRRPSQRSARSSESDAGQAARSLPRPPRNPVFVVRHRAC